MSFEADFADALLKYLIPTIASIGTIYYIGNKIKQALCANITDLTIELRSHVGISDKAMEKLEEVERRLNKLILNNNLKI